MTQKLQTGMARQQQGEAAKLDAAIATTSLYQRKRGAAEGAAINRDIPGFCKSATLDEIRQNGYVLIPGRYVGAA